jgi:hypothetical protein
MSSTNRLIAIISTTILILNYIQIPIEMFFFKESQLLLKLNTDFFKVVFVLSLGTTFFYFARYFNSISERKIERLIYLGISLSVLSQALKLFTFYEQQLYLVISSLIYLTLFVIVVIWGIKILKLNESVDKNIKLSKIFVISLFGVFVLNVVGIPILFFNQLMEYLDLIFLSYIVPYSILTILFWRLKTK